MLYLMGMLGTDSLTLISHRKKTPLSLVNAVHVPAYIIHLRDHSNKLISMMNAGFGKKQIDVCSEKRCATFEEAAH